MDCPYRIGLGHDTHRVGVGGPMWLGGVAIDCELHLIGHSDADVLLHAVTDAILGAAGLEDIGQLFPNTDEANHDRDSAEMLGLAHARVIAAGFQIVNLDCVVRAERPKIMPVKAAIGARMAEILNISPGQVSLKGKTGESIGTIGRGEAIEANCVALLARRGEKG